MFLSLVLVFFFSASAFADIWPIPEFVPMTTEEESFYLDYANCETEMLKSLGLFLGTDKGFELERPGTRTEASVMLIRLLGKEAEAKASEAKHPFTDVPAWADSYIAYMYENGLTNGVSATLFGSNNTCTAQMYITFVLRALGYSETKGHFTYAGTLDFAAKQQVVSREYAQLLENKNFIRADMATISRWALDFGVNESDDDDYSFSYVLYEKLIYEGLFTEEDYFNAWHLEKELIIKLFEKYDENFIDEFIYKYFGRLIAH
jgi:hypothetical protein